MRAPKAGRGRATRAAPAVSLLLVGAMACATPVASPSAGVSAGPSSVPQPTTSPPIQPLPSSGPTPVSTPDAGAWSLYGGFPSGFRAMDAVYGGLGWVVVGFSCVAACDEGTPATLHSPDGGAWSIGSVGSAQITSMSVAWREGYWLAALGDDRTGGETHSVATVWRSDDGRSWERTAALDLGPCLEGCPGIGEISSWAGGLLIEWIDFTDQTLSGPYRSVDGSTWQRVDPAPLGVSSTWSGGIDAVAFGELIVLAAPAGPGTAVWSSGDGRTWTSMGKLALEQGGGEILVAADGERLVVAAAVCPAEGSAHDSSTALEAEVQLSRCQTAVWTSVAAGDWTGPVVLDAIHAQVAYTGTEFLLAGVSPDGAATFAAPDGADWRELTAMPWGDCNVGALAGGGGHAFLFGDGDCPVVWTHGGA